ncbi:MAG: hypothetical protein E2O39_11400 [Planctomycetota bacterium]|nr:MAG: hypothetical protein E2O39_11400 [Planctomycetota bacterium]
MMASPRFFPTDSLPIRLPALLLAALPIGAQEPMEAAADTEPTSELTWQERVARDGRIGFTTNTVREARAVLVDPDAAPEHRATALLALGAAGAIGERPALQSAALEGSLDERVAAILGLGEMDRATRDRFGASDHLLEEQLASTDERIAASALCALLRSGSPEWRARAVSLAAAPEERLGSAAAAMLDFVLHPEASRYHPVLDELLELRWDAARRFGTVDGLAWSAALMEELMREETFMDEVVLLSSTGLRFSGLRDHLLEILLGGHGPARLRAAMRAMPNKVQLLIASELWLPANDAEWRIIVDEAIRTGGAPLLPELFESAVRVRCVAPTAAGVLTRMGRDHGDLLVAALTVEDEELRARAAWGIAEGGLEQHVRLLRKLSDDSSPTVRASAIVARIRLGDKDAPEEARGFIEDSRGDDVGRGALLRALCTARRVPGVVGLLLQVEPLLSGTDRASVLACLHASGRIAGTAELRAAFRGVDPGSEAGLALLHEIGSFPSSEDLDFLAGLFPLEDELAANVEIAIALVHEGHPKVDALIPRAVWHEPWNRSVLAAAVVKDKAGMRRLIQMVDKPPGYATSEDIRRLGFAIGELGGLDAVRDLARNLGAGADRPALQGALLGALAAQTH